MKINIKHVSLRATSGKCFITPTAYASLYFVQPCVWGGGSCATFSVLTKGRVDSRGPGTVCF